MKQLTVSERINVCTFWFRFLCLHVHTRLQMSLFIDLILWLVFSRWIVPVASVLSCKANVTIVRYVSRCGYIYICSSIFCNTHIRIRAFLSWVWVLCYVNGFLYVYVMFGCQENLGNRKEEEVSFRLFFFSSYIYSSSLLFFIVQPVTLLLSVDGWLVLRIGHRLHVGGLSRQLVGDLAHALGDLRAHHRHLLSQGGRGGGTVHHCGRHQRHSFLGRHHRGPFVHLLKP